MSLALDYEDKEISPATKTNPQEVSQSEKDFLSVIVDEFNKEFSRLEWKEIRAHIRRLAVNVAATASENGL